MGKNNQKASLKISQDVLETISKVSALEVEGVADTAIPENQLRWKNSPIDIKITDGVAEVQIGLILDFGAKISEVCEKVQRNIKENIQTMTGIMVSKVHIAVEGIKLPENKEKVAPVVTTIHIEE